MTKNDIPADLDLKIPGEHNKLNAVMAMKVAEVLEVPSDEIKKVLETFAGVPGRLELVRNFEGMTFYNDTTATTPDATINAINALSEKGKVILIMGGFDKGLDMSRLIKLTEKVKNVVLLPGSGSDSIVEKGLTNYEKVMNMKEAVLKANSLAASSDIILMSPAFASFGLFKNEFDRGDQFDQAVNNL